ncbi:MAG: WecB/TagA/CpsF family glycosyltransferase [Verrucomicrobia bacterium]|nr:WecB/TagA/CpsF family glycosyltransferase [Verrucomicrobiota bacterium]
MAQSLPERVNILGVGVHATHMQEAVRALIALADDKGKGYVCVTGVHGVMESQSSDALRAIHNHSFLTVPDGMPMVWVGRLRGHKTMSRVYGPDLMLAVCEATCRTGHTHFLYGGKDGVAEDLKSALEKRFPGICIAGTYSPPFRPLNETERSVLRERCKADFFWVGLSTPKQEHFMAGQLGALPVHVMLGVGAAFDLHTGRMLDAPDWMKRAGLQWLHRFAQEPKRLARRYLINNPAFILKIVIQSLGLKRYTLHGE